MPRLRSAENCYDPVGTGVNAVYDRKMREGGWPVALIRNDKAVCHELLSPLALWLPGYYPEKGVRLHDGNAAERNDVRQVVITGNDEIGLAFQCAGEYLVVVWVSVDFVHFHHSGNKIDDLRKGPEEPVNLLRRRFVNLLKFGAKKGSFDLPEYIFRKADIYLPLTGRRQDRAGFPVGTR